MYDDFAFELVRDLKSEVVDLSSGGGVGSVGVEDTVDMLCHWVILTVKPYREICTAFHPSLAYLPQFKPQPIIDRVNSLDDRSVTLGRAGGRERRFCQVQYPYTGKHVCCDGDGRAPDGDDEQHDCPIHQ
jgi:hypothetical protein